MPLEFSREQITTPLFRFEHQAMACDWELFIAHEDGEYARQAADAAWDEVDLIENDLSRFREGSDVRRLNSAEAGDTIRVGLHARDCLLLAGEISELTSGAFDVMVGRAMDEIRAGRNSSPDFLPRDSLLEIDPVSGAVTISGDSVAIDMGALGKGYAIDALMQVLRDWNIKAALAHAGTSSVYALGAPTGLEGWPLALRDPRGEAIEGDGEATLATIILCDKALGSSGTAIKGNHILDPRTGLAEQGNIASWCLCESAAHADAFSTAFMVMNAEEIQRFQQENSDVSGAVIVKQGENSFWQRWGVLEELKWNSRAAEFEIENKIQRGELAPQKSGTDPIIAAFLRRRVTVIWKSQEKRDVFLLNASRDWLHLEDGGVEFLVPREAILCLMVADAKA